MQKVMEESFDGQKSLQLIESMINKARNAFSESGTIYLVWGIVAFLCALEQFVIVERMNDVRGYNVWLLSWGVVIFQFFYFAKRRKSERVKTYTGDIIKYVWLAFMVSLCLLIFILLYLELHFVIYPVILVMYGIPTFLSGVILRFRPLIAGAIICWILSVSCTFSQQSYQVLYICAAVVFAWIIPGFLLRRKFYKQEVNH